MGVLLILFEKERALNSLLLILLALNMSKYSYISTLPKPVTVLYAVSHQISVTGLGYSNGYCNKACIEHFNLSDFRVLATMDSKIFLYTLHEY